jgi:group I intron endonuclease
MKNTIILFNENLPNQPIIIYDNVEIDKSKILSDLKGLSEIYMFTHKESGKKYIGSAIDLSKRLKNYFNPSFLDRNKYMYISRDLLFHEYSAFSLTILEYVNTSNLSKEQSRLLILEKEQIYIDTLDPEYNLLRVAGFLLGYQHNEETKKILSKAHLGKIISATTKAKMSLLRKAFLRSALRADHPLRGRSGKNHPRRM